MPSYLETFQDHPDGAGMVLPDLIILVTDVYVCVSRRQRRGGLSKCQTSKNQEI